MIWSLLTVLVFAICLYLIKKWNVKFVNPVLTSIAVLVLILVLTNTAYIKFSTSTKWITDLLGPIVVMLAVPLYKSCESLKKNFIPILAAILSSIVTSLLSVYLMSHILSLEPSIYMSLMSKSITTPMAIEVTEMIGGVPGLTVVFVISTGILGATFSEFTLNLFKVKNPIAKGIGIGASAHGIGTAKAVEMGDEVAAASGLAMGLTGVMTVLSFSIITKFLIF